MNTETALEFLRLHQPLPSDKEISQEVLDKYDEIRKWFIANPDERCIPLFLNSFGEGSGFGVYQLVEDVFFNFTKEVMVPYLYDSLQSQFVGVQSWCSEIAGSFPDEKLIEPLSNLINSDFRDVRAFALSALSFIKTAKAKELISNRLKIEKDDHVKETIRDILSEME